VGTIETLEGELEDELWLDCAHRAELLDHVGPHKRVNAPDLGVGETRVGLRDRHQRAGTRVPDSDRIIGVQAGALAAAALGAYEHGVDRTRLDFPLPPVSPAPAHAITRAEPLEHQTFGLVLATAGLDRGEL